MSIPALVALPSLPLFPVLGLVIASSDSFAGLFTLPLELMYVDLNGNDGAGIDSNLLTAIPAELPSEPSPAFFPSSHLLVQTMPGACQTGPHNTTSPSFPVENCPQCPHLKD